MQPDLRNPLSFGEVVSSYVAGPQAYNFAPVETWLRCGSSMLWLSFGCVGQSSWWYQKTLVKIRLFTFSFGMMLRMYDDLHEVRMEQNRDKRGSEKWLGDWCWQLSVYCISKDMRMKRPSISFPAKGLQPLQPMQPMSVPNTLTSQPPQPIPVTWQHSRCSCRMSSCQVVFFKRPFPTLLLGDANADAGAIVCRCIAYSEVKNEFPPKTIHF